MADAGGKTKREMESAACTALDRFAREFLGWPPRTTRAYLIHGLLVIRFQGELSAGELRLLQTPDRGRDLVKQMRCDLVEMARPILGAMVEEITGLKVVSLHHDLSTVTGEEVLFFTLAQSPPVLTTRK